MLAASGFDILKHASSIHASDAWILTIGTVMAFVTALSCIRTFLRYIERHDFRSFGWYRIAVAVAFWLFVLR